MKKVLITAVLAAVLSVSALFSDEVTAIWSRLYSRARGYEDKIMTMKGLVEIDEESIIPFLGSALQELNEARANEMSVTQNMQHVELTKLIVRRLGEFKSADFSDLMYDVYKNTMDVYLRAETVLALGRDGFDVVKVSGKSLEIKYYGSYSGSAEAHYAIDDYMKENGLVLNEVAIEEYITDPSNEPDTTKWLTNIYYLVQ